MSADGPVWTLLQQVALQLAVIAVAGGYRTDLGQTVTTELTQLHADDPDADPPPRIVVAVAEQISFERPSTQTRIRRFRVACEATFWGDETNGQQQAHAALEDMLDALPSRAEYVQVSGEISSDVTVTSAEVLARPEGLPVTAAVVLLDVVMREQRPPPEVPTPVPPP